MAKELSIKEFIEYLNVGTPKSSLIHSINYDSQKYLRKNSDSVAINFFILAIKIGMDLKESIEFGQTEFDQGDAFVYFDKPGSTLEWNIESTLSGYNILIDEKLLNKSVKTYNFLKYKSHEALFVTKSEETLLMDLFEKAHLEFLKEDFSNEIMVSYCSLILSYINNFYKRQFDSREQIYNKVVSDFYRHLEEYYDDSNNAQLPYVSYFAEKSNLSSNYFGDVIKHFTDHSPQELIHQHILQLAKSKLRQTELSVSEIAYSLGYEYPTYFTRFFKKETGITPTVFREK